MDKEQFVELFEECLKEGLLDELLENKFPEIFERLVLSGVISFEYSKAQNYFSQDEIIVRVL